ncbi:MAG: hypothetical protein A3J76_00010 [Candidatus Moranbacteria bacterium RBG_13_45_13]|nr:MAG: hypothetical protein A3J76_00010 [Candidatus Moranbacteria bacterium RBG_13_45_13]
MSTLPEVLDFDEFFTLRRRLALRDAVGGQEGVEKILSGKYEVQMIEKILPLVDHTGRLIPTHLGVTKAVCDENRNFRLNRTEFGIGFYADILARFQQFFPADTVFVSAEEFVKRAEAAKVALLKNPLLANLFNRAAWLLPLPQYDVQDMGRSMQEFFLLAAAAAYANQFPKRKFNNYCGEMTGKILPLADYNGYDQFIAIMKSGPGVAWYFPNPMQGFSMDAQREAGKFLRSYNLTLNGPIEPMLALVGFTAEMGRDFHTPGYDCPATSWRSAGSSLYFGAYDGGFCVRDSGYLDAASGRSSGGLVLLG